MYCNNCGAVLDDNSRFCNKCGAVVGDTAPSGTVPVSDTVFMHNENGQPGLEGIKGSPGSISRKKLITIIVAVVAIAAITTIVIANMKSRPVERAEDYYDFYTKDEFNQMMEDYERKEESRPKGIGEKTIEDYIDSVYGDGDEIDEELEEKLKNSASPWFKDSGESSEKDTGN